MRKNETLEQERARKLAEAALPADVQRCMARVAQIKAEVIAATTDLQSRHQSNPGGERSGMLQ